MGNQNSQRLTVFWILFAFGVWIYAFRGFLTSKFGLASDALSYYDHTKFFVENLARGVFPLWDPFWYNGTPNDFFLRRIGALNPFYLFILALKTIGVPYTLAYLWFLAGYYWSGMIAFYLLAMRIYQDRFIAYGGYLILLFSALGTRLFDSYMMLITVPVIWFFYFLIAFTQTPRKHFFLGLVLSFMILAGTYIPFYFLIILGLFSLLFFLIYADQVPAVFRGYIKFLKANKILVFLSLLVLVFSFFPIINFFHKTASGQIVLPTRHGSGDLGHALTVPRQTLDWGAVEDLMYSAFFSDLTLYKFAVVYVPFFSIIVFLLGLIGRINRRVVLMLLLGLVLFCLIVPYGLPFYDFCYSHIFFLKYFRNLHFFIWFFLIPLFVMLVLEHWHAFAAMISKNSRNRPFFLLYIFCVHVLILLFVWWRKDAITSTYVMVILSLAFWSLYAVNHLRPNAWGYALLTLTLLIQPLEVYHYFSLKADPYVGPYNYDFSFFSLPFKDPEFFIPKNDLAGKDALYYASGGYNFIYQNISNTAMLMYLRDKFILVDRLQYLEQDKAAAVLQRHFLSDDNTAFVFKGKGMQLKLNGNDPYPPIKARHIDSSSEEFKLLAFDANHVRLKLDLPYEKFLIYNDSYDPLWRVSINNQQVPLIEVNGAFKGVWVPAAPSVVEFSYGAWWQYAMNILLSVFAFIVLTGIVYYAFVSHRRQRIG